MWKMQIIVPNLFRYVLPSKADNAVKDNLTCDAPPEVRFHVPASGFLKRHVVTFVLVMFVGFGFWVLGDYGVPGDTDDQRDLPLRLIDYLLGQDVRFLHPIDRFFGVTFEFPLYLVERALGLDDSRDIHLMRHMVTHLFFLTGGLFCYLLVYRMFNSRLLAVVGMLLFLLHPRIYAHSFFNSKDAPFLSMFMICLYLTHWAFERGNVWRFLILGVAVGVLINLRVMGITLFLPIVVIRMMDCISERGDRRRVALTVAVFVVSTLLTVYVSLPYLWTDPIGHSIEWLGIAAAHPDRLSQLFQGELILSKNINPLEYVTVWISITTPPAVIVMSVVGTLVILLRGLIAPHVVFKNTQLRFCFLIMACLMSPIAIATFLDANLFNGWRHLYFLYVPLCLLAVTAVDWIRSIHFLWLKILTHGAIGVGIAASVVSMASIHPHEYIYFNFLVDRTTPDHLRSQYETDYLFMSHLEGFNNLLDRYPSSSLHVQLSNNDVNDLSWEILAEADRGRMIRENKPSDFYIVNYYTFRPYGTEMQDVTAPLIYRRVIYNNKFLDVLVPDLYQVDDAVAEQYKDTYQVAVSGEPVERSLWDIYVDGRTLIYINEECVADDYISAFFLHVSPDNTDDLPGHRRRTGHVTRNFDFEFGRHGVRFDDKCMVIVQLPSDGISGVRTGQFTSNDELWSVAINMRLGGEDAYRAEYEAILNHLPVITSEFNVYRHESRLIYVRDSCSDSDTDAKFFLHIYPVDADDIPAERKESGFDNLGFVFETHGLMFDGMCVASIGLPDYDIKRIRTGQWEPEQQRDIWKEEFDVGR